jgi:hypothetical protein
VLLLLVLALQMSADHCQGRRLSGAAGSSSSSSSRPKAINGCSSMLFVLARMRRLRAAKADGCQA